MTGTTSGDTAEAGPQAQSPRAPSGGSAGRAWLAWAAIAVVLAVALSWGAVRDPGPQTDQDRVTVIARTIKCPGCAGETVAESNAASSREIRADIARRIDQGQSDDEIRAHYAATYGSSILLTPEGSGASALVWAIPVVVVGLTAFGLVVVFRRRRLMQASEPQGGPGAPVAPVPSEERQEPAVAAGAVGEVTAVATGTEAPVAGSSGSSRRSARLRTAAVAVAVLVVAGGIGWWVARSSGSRSPSDEVSGNVRSSTIQDLSDAGQYTAMANQLLADGDGQGAIEAFQQAIAAYDRVLEVDPDNTEAMTYRGWLLHNIALSASPEAAAELDARALEWISQAIAIDPGYADARIFRAIMLRASHPAEALADIETVAPAAVPPAMREMVEALRRQLQEAAAQPPATTPAEQPG